MITAHAAIIGGAGPIESFRARDRVPDRKHLKLMPRAVALGVAAVREALEARPGWQSVPPERRGLFVGASPAATDPEALADAVRAASGPDGFDVARFGADGVPLVPPLWLVQGLTNNVLGFSAAYHDLRGPNTTRCDGRIGGLAAVIDAARAVAEGRCDLAVAGAADSLVHLAAWSRRPVGEAAAFFVIESDGVGPRLGELAIGFDAPRPVDDPVELGAAAGVVRLVERLGGGRVEVHDPSGAWAALTVYGS